MEGNGYSEDLMGDRDYSKELEDFLKEHDVSVSSCTKERDYYVVTMIFGLTNLVKNVHVSVVEQFFRKSDKESEQAILNAIKEPAAK